HSSFEYAYLLLPAIGFIVGLYGSMLGGGGGFFFIPILTLLYNFPAQISIATSLAASLPICIVGSFGHYKNANIDIHTGMIFAFFGIAGALMGAKLTSLISANQLKISFGIYSIIMAIIMLLGKWREKQSLNKGLGKPVISGVCRIIVSSVFGFISGIITGTFGTSGTAPVQSSLFAMGVPLKIVLGTSLMVSTVNNFSAIGGHFLVGEIDLTLVFFLTSGAIIGAILGPKLLAGIKIGKTENPIRLLYALGMIVFGIIMIIKK
ncbi:MAG: sulfite exporter TauE/SafE family protein, partial [Bacteroidales bacterium]|nr:sulfite exporter TauE/SafE family protein [Bacteroidales bacterium]